MFGSIIQDMVADMDEARLNAVGQLAAVLEGTPAVDFRSQGNNGERYGFIGSVVARVAYRLGRADKGVVMRYLGRTGYSRQQLPRLIGRCLKGQKLTKRYRRPAQGFARKYTAADVTLLAQTDALHQALSGPATRCLMQRAFTVYGDARYARPATLSAGHLYNLRRQAGYQATRLHWTKTKGHAVPIGERRAPAPDGRPGFIRIDSVHQGDQDGAEGLYHINAVDCVTQFEIVATCERLSEASLLPVLGQIPGFPFELLGAKPLSLLCRGRVNFHRPCFFPDTVTDSKGKIRMRYVLEDMSTPNEKIESLPDAAQFLKPGVTFAQLDARAAAMSDNEAARRLNEARAKLFQTLHPRSEHVA